MRLNDFLNTSSANQSTSQFEVSTSLGKEAISTRMYAISRAIARVRQLEAYSPLTRSSSYGHVAVSPELAPDGQANISAVPADFATAEADVDQHPVAETAPAPQDPLHLAPATSVAAAEASTGRVQEGSALDPQAIRQQVKEAYYDEAA